MAISFNTGTTSFVTGTGTPGGHTFTIPAGVANGDKVLVLVFIFTTATGTIVPTLSSSATAPSQQGTTQTESGAGIIAAAAAFLINATGSDGGATLTYGATGGSGGSYWENVVLGSYSGAGGVDVIAGTGFFNASSLGDTTTPSATTVASGDWQVQMIGIGPPNGNDLSTPGGLTLRENIDKTQNQNIIAKLADSNASVGGGGTSIGNTAWAHSGSASADSTWSTSFTVGLKPPAVAGSALLAGWPP